MGENFSKDFNREIEVGLIYKDRVKQKLIVPILSSPITFSELDDVIGKPS